MLIQSLWWIFSVSFTHIVFFMKDALIWLAKRIRVSPGPGGP